MEKSIEMKKFKDIESLKDLSTKRLLSYYKTRRKDKHRFYSSHCCECCGMTSWELYPKDPSSIEAKKVYEDMKMYLAIVKDLLNSRENV